MDWPAVLIIAVGILVLLFTSRWWLASLMKTTGGRPIRVMWAGKEYGLSVPEAERALQQQGSIILDDVSGVSARLMALPNVKRVELAPRLVGMPARLTGELVIRVVVTKKLPQMELNAEDVIPREIGGVRTDVVEE